ncbi:MAG: M13-type metalloendopeptidase [Methanothrix sp.]
MMIRIAFGQLAKEAFRIAAFISLILLTQMPCQMAAGISDNGTPAFDPNNMDRSIHPGDDFYQYVNGGWIVKNPVPSDKTDYNEFVIVEDRTDEQVLKLVERASNNTSAKESSLDWKIGRFYSMGLDTDSINRQGIEPLHGELKLIDNITTASDVQRVSARLLSYYIIDPLFSFYSSPDSKNSKVMIASLYQSGLGLPDRDYYLRIDNESAKTREDYLKFAARMFILRGDSSQNASRDAQTIMRMETRLANASFTNIENRDAVKTYHRMTLAQMHNLSPEINWTLLLSDVGYPDIKEINVNQPAFVKETGKMIETESVEDWKTFLRWKLISATAPYLSSEFENESFDFYGRKLNGQEQMQPRWKRVLKTENAFLGEPIGRLYIQQYFDPQSKARMEDMVKNLKTAFRGRLQNLTWMENATKVKALEKLEAMDVQVGYPEEWQNYSLLEIENDSYVRNVLRAGKFQFEHGYSGLDKAGKPVNRDTWFAPSHEVNAFAYFEMNAIFFPAGILQPPFFNARADDAINYGAIGAVIGHEMTHGFDDQGRKFDKNGNLTDWWTEQDGANFNNSTKVLIGQYDKLEALPGLYVNGNLTLGENIADMGGLTMAYYAYHLAQQNETMKIDGFSADQRFFLGNAQMWRDNIRNESLRTKVLTNPHSPCKFRINGVVFNMPEFYLAFSEIKPGDKLYRPEEERPAIW